MNPIPKSLVKTLENIRCDAVSRVIRCLVGVKILNSMLKIKTLVRSMLLSLYLI